MSLSNICSDLSNAVRTGKSEPQAVERFLNSIDHKDDPKKIIEREAKSQRRRDIGQFRTRSYTDVSFNTESMEWETRTIQTREPAVAHLMNECLGWKGFGFGDGCDIGSGTMNVFCFVVDAKAAAPHVVEVLKKKGLIEGAVVAIGGRPKVVWPDGYKEKFLI